MAIWLKGRPKSDQLKLSFEHGAAKTKCGAHFAKCCAMCERLQSGLFDQVVLILVTNASTTVSSVAQDVTKRVTECVSS